MQARLERVVAQARKTADLAQLFDDCGRITAACAAPLGLAGVKHVGDAKEAVLGARAPGNGRRPQAKAVKVDLAVDEVDLVGVDVIGLELLVRPFVETRAVRAGVAGVFNDCHGRVGVAKLHLDHGRGVDVLTGGLGVGRTQQLFRLRLLLRRWAGVHVAPQEIPADADGDGHEGHQKTSHERCPSCVLFRMFDPNRSSAARRSPSSTGAAISAAACTGLGAASGAGGLGRSKATCPSAKPVAAV